MQGKPLWGGSRRRQHGPSHGATFSPNWPGGCGWAERAQTWVYELMEDFGWLSWGGGPEGVGLSWCRQSARLFG